MKSACFIFQDIFTSLSKISVSQQEVLASDTIANTYYYLF